MPHPHQPAAVHCVAAPAQGPTASIQPVAQQADWLGAYLPPASLLELDPGQALRPLRISESPPVHRGDIHVYLLTRRLRL